MATQRTGIDVPGIGEAKEVVQRKRLIVSVRGEEREGKTQFALTAPEPIMVFPFDNNSAELIQKWRMFKTILVPDMPLDLNMANKDEWEPLWDRFKELYLACVKSKYIRTIVIDTMTDAYELSRLARFGKLSEVPPHFYGKVNMELATLVKTVYPTDKNLILIHRVKDQYKGSNRTGERILDGYQAVGYKVQMNILSWRDLSRRSEDGSIQGFGITMDNCTQNEEIAGTYLEEPANTFGELGKLVYKGSTDADWV